MDSIEIIALIVTIVCLVCFSIVFTILFRHYFYSNMEKINNGEEDIEIIEYAIEEEKKKAKKTRKVVRIITKTISYIVLSIVLVFFGVALYSKFSHNPIFFGDSSLVVIATGSMSEKNPLNEYLYDNNLNNQFDAYDVIGISKYQSQEDIKLYDVIAYHNDDQDIIVHSIVEIDELDNGEIVYITQGDANEDNDAYSQYGSYLTYDRIIGHYNETRIPGVGIFVIFLQSSAGIITIVAIAYCLFMFDYYNSKYERLIVERTNKLVELLDYDLTKPYQDDVKLIYKEELIYKNNIYTFLKGEFVSKEEIKDEETLKRVKNNMVFIKTIEENSKKKNIFIKNVKTNVVKKVDEVDEDNVKEVVKDSIEVEESKDDKND